MRAIAIKQYGDPDVLEPTDMPDPKVGPDSVLVRVAAAAVNPVDFKIRRGYLDGAFETYFPLVLGWDVAGVVEAVGPAVSEFAVSDEVCGYLREDYLQHGTYAEFVASPVRCLARRPASVSFEEAAALPLAGLTAYQALTKALHVAEDDVVLVHAASGGVGSMAVQIARILGARVIGTASESNHAYLRELGAEPVPYGDGLVDRVRDLAPQGVSAILDLVGGEALAATPELMGGAGRLASVIDAGTARELGGAYVFVRPDPIDLATIVRYVDEGRLHVNVSGTYPLVEAAEAHRALETGHTRGKIVLSV
ncbi:MAG: NADP-dependent oxidoreductase [Streptosporangiaceae bacterium]